MRNDKLTVQKLEKEIKILKRQISDLELKNESQSIIIEALVNQTKLISERTIYTDSDSDNKRIKATDTDETLSDKTTCDPFPTEFIENDSQKIPAISEIELFSKQIKETFYAKDKNFDFKLNYSYFKFIEFAENSYEFSLNNKKISKCKNPLKIYIVSNLDKIIKLIIENINTLNLNQLCSSLFLINSEINYKQKLVIAHDIILKIDNPSKILYLFSALFNNIELKDDSFAQTLKRIMYHQYCIDTDLYIDETIYGYLETIKDNFGLSLPSVNLWESVPLILSSGPFFYCSNPSLKGLCVKSSVIERGFIIRMLCHYLDWDFTYNTVILAQLFPLISSERSSYCVYYAGILTMNAYRLFGKDQSVTLVFRELLVLMGDDSDVSIVCYLILKQLYEAECMRWLENTEELLIKRGFTVEYLTSFLLI